MHFYEPASKGIWQLCRRQSHLYALTAQLPRKKDPAATVSQGTNTKSKAAALREESNRSLPTDAVWSEACTRRRSVYVSICSPGCSLEGGVYQVGWTTPSALRMFFREQRVLLKRSASTLQCPKVT